jgi:hypothetical protein
VIICISIKRPIGVSINLVIICVSITHLSGSGLTVIGRWILLSADFPDAIHAIHTNNGDPMTAPTEPRAQAITSLWDDAHAATLSEPELLLYRSNLLGSDMRITNFGGGNTSAKIAMTDPLSGEQVEVLWVKGSGGDLGSIKLDGFSTLYMERLRALKARYRGLALEDEMVAYLPHCTFNLNPRAASIDTPLHAYIGRRHVDHMHPDAVIAIAA